MHSSVLVGSVEYKLIQSVKSGCGKLFKFFKSEAGGFVVYISGVYFFFKTLSAASFTAFLASIGFGSMAAGLVVLIIGREIFSWLWDKLWN